MATFASTSTVLAEPHNFLLAQMLTHLTTIDAPVNDSFCEQVKLSTGIHHYPFFLVGLLTEQQIG